MDNHFNFLKQKYFPRGGNLKDLGISRAYLELLTQGIVPPSRSIIHKIIKEYGVSSNDAFMEGLITKSNAQPLLFASETLSNNEGFVKKLKQKDKVSYEDLTGLVGEFYMSMHVKGRLSKILTNIPNYFNLVSMDERLPFFTEPEFNLSSELKNPWVCLHHENITEKDFMNYKKETKNGEKNVTYDVKKEYFPYKVKRIWTDSKNWRKTFPEGSDSPRRKPYEVTYNKVFVEYKEPFKQEILDALRGEIDEFSSKFNPDFITLTKGIGSLFDEYLLKTVSHKESNKLLENEASKAIKLEDSNVLSFYFYPVQTMIHAMKSGGGDNYVVGPGTLKMANRIQSYVENRIKV